jgi:hypothetical protein
MPNGVFPLSQFDSQLLRRYGSGPRLRMRTRWWRDRLDELARGADPAASAALAVRAAQLRSPGLGPASLGLLPMSPSSWATAALQTQQPTGRKR